jgi:hypothetical protein
MTDFAQPLEAPWKRSCVAAALILVGLAVATLELRFMGKHPIDRLTSLLASRQDLPLVPVLVAILLFARGWAKAGTPADQARRLVPWIAGSIALILLVGWAGHYVVFHGYDFSRDEQMASFDMAIFRTGRLFSPIPAEWRPFADALNLHFILPIGEHEFWVSAYLPLNAAWRAAVSLISDPALASPLMAAFGAFCIWRVSRLLWPESAATQLVSMLLYVCSSQVLVTAMTAFSMSMHLALNMLWLWLFLLDRRRNHAAAMVVGWAATGIHQPLFHPLFVLPFLLLLAGQKRWRLLAAYLLAYALIAAFWLAWPVWISAHGTAPPAPTGDVAGIGYFERLLSVIETSNVNGPWLTAANLLRFVCWQHPFLVPLAIVGVWSNFRHQPVCRALSIGLALPILVMAVLLPWQGNGWGYRYLHPVLGNAILLGAYGWHTLETHRINLRTAMLSISAVALLILFPLQSTMAHQMVSPIARLHGVLDSTDADILIVDLEGVPFGEDLVVNDPNFANRPTLLVAQYIRSKDIESLCRLGSIAFVPRQRLSAMPKVFGTNPPTAPSPYLLELVAEARRAGCTVVRRREATPVSTAKSSSSPR